MFTISFVNVLCCSLKFNPYVSPLINVSCPNANNGSIVIFGMVYFFKKSKTQGEHKEYNELEQKLISMNRILNTEELDELLGIEHMDIDSKKFKRNRMINEMNQRHSDFIIRIKDDTDKRRYLYQVNK